MPDEDSVGNAAGADTHSADAAEKTEKPENTEKPVRVKLTAEILDQRLQARKAARLAKRAQREADKAARTHASYTAQTRRGFLITLGVVTATAIIVRAVTATQQDAEQSRNAAALIALQSDVATIANVAELDARKPFTSADVDAFVVTIRARAQSVAELQAEYAALYVADNATQGPGNGTPSDAARKIPAQRKKLAPYFSDLTVSDDDTAYGLATVVPFDETVKIDPRWPWFVRFVTQPNGEVVPSPATSYGWRIEAITPDITAMAAQRSASMRRKSVVAEVTWVCEQTADKQVLAWARATYVVAAGEAAAQGTFTDLSVATSILGGTYREAK